MPDTVVLTEDPNAVVAAPQDAALLERIRRLEDALAQRPAPVTAVVPHDEEQLAERLLTIISAKAAQHRAATSNVPAAPLGVAPIQTYAQYPFPPGAAMPPNEPSVWSWFTSSVLGEIKLIVRMYLDPRYRLSRFAQLGVPIILVAFVFNYFFFLLPPIGAIPIVREILERFVCVLLSIGLYKVLARELIRYRQVLEYLSQYGQH